MGGNVSLKVDEGICMLICFGYSDLNGYILGKATQFTIVKN
jgi:hypothetical protein